MNGAMIRHTNPQAVKGLADRLEKLASREIAVGFPQGKCQAYPDGTSVASVAAAHVYGIGVPVRDFMAYAKPAVIEKTKPILAAAARQAAQGDLSGLNAFQEAAGQVGAAEVKNGIVAGDYTPNSPQTIALKGSSKPLVDTAHMLQAVTYVVRARTR